jgi:aryl-alcohol dehydrogenase-like predicted oxidoreductase
MDYTRLGTSGLNVSRIALGCMSFGEHRGFSEWSMNEADVGPFFAQAVELGIPMAQVALAWVLKNPIVTAPIVGATKPHHLTDAAAALDVQLTEEEIRSLEEPYIPQPPAGL